jgi:UPF0716 family protein affecting phage T7 exclusion
LAPFKLLKWLLLTFYNVLSAIAGFITHILYLILIIFLISYFVWHLYDKYEFIKEHWEDVKNLKMDDIPKYGEKLKNLIKQDYEDLKDKIDHKNDDTNKQKSHKDTEKHQAN